MSATTRCDSCGREEPEGELQAVHRVYLTPAGWDAEERIDVVEDIERWCASCRSTYPHQLDGSTELEL